MISVSVADIDGHERVCESVNEERLPPTKRFDTIDACDDVLTSEAEEVWTAARLAGNASSGLGIHP